MSPRSFKPDSSSLVSLGRAVKALRAEAGLTQIQLAEQAGTHASYVSHIERGVTNLTWTGLGRLAQGLGVARSALVNRVEDLERRG
jgi:transcriptional regulator with XRE-family HTH domain